VRNEGLKYGTFYVERSHVIECAIAQLKESEGYE
jgi:hypothetical protein